MKVSIVFFVLIAVGLADDILDQWENVVSDIIHPGKLVFTNSCIEDLGCFYTGPPFFDPLQRPISLPPSKKIDEIHFLLFTPSSPNDTYSLESNLTSLENSTFDPTLETKILIHGYTVDLESGDIRYDMKDALLNLGDYNVIIVDWTKLDGQPYPQACANARVVGAKLAKLIDFVLNNTAATPESFHLIGHSLGGHVAGYAGKRIENLGRITGLDPAGPFFHNVEPEVRLDLTDALFVDVIHTDGGESVLTGFGTNSPLGHMDFYPNGGMSQPGCVHTSSKDNVVGAALNFTPQFIGSNSCDHSRANDYFLESIDNSRCKFLSVLCNSYSDYENGLCPPGNSTVAEMGFHNTPIAGLEPPAKFFLRTNGETPYCNQDSIFI